MIVKKLPVIQISTSLPNKQIDPKIYGHFLESAFFGNIDGGVIDEGSPLSVSGEGLLSGCRKDVIEACKDLGLPIVRWPGGNFTSPYWWEDGIGPKEHRPRRLELAWGAEESNRFGTAEFLAWCEEVGTTPFLVHNARNVDDAVRWVEYTNYNGDTSYTRKRAQDGHPAPHGVRYWGIGNEVYGHWQMGLRSAANYVADAVEHARFMKLVDPELSFIAVGWENQSWTETVVAGLGDVVDFFSLHLYGASLHLIDPSVAEFDSVVQQSLYFEQVIHEYAELISKVSVEQHIKRPLGIAMDEWNMRHLEPSAWPEPLPGSDGGIADRVIDAEVELTQEPRVNRYSPRTLADALFYAGVFHALHRASQLDVPVTMANTVNLINANGLIAVRPEGLVKAATFHVWDLYQNHMGPDPLPVSITGPARPGSLRLGTETLRANGEFRTRPVSVPFLDGSATLSADHKTLHLAVINRSAEETIEAIVELAGHARPTRARMRDIGARTKDLFASNSLTDPEQITLSEPATVELSEGSYAFPAHSITLLDFDVSEMRFSIQSV